MQHPILAFPVEGLCRNVILMPFDYARIASAEGSRLFQTLDRSRFFTFVQNDTP
jgi:hypothetical protein